ncbi:hypothetical protein Tco_0742764 [Tanacetum coccineum]
MADLLELGSSGCDLLDFFRHCKLLCASKACLINRLHPCLIANQLAQLAVEHPVQLVCTSSSSPCDMRIVLPGCGILSLVPGVLKKFEENGLRLRSNWFGLSSFLYVLVESPLGRVEEDCIYGYHKLRFETASEILASTLTKRASD